MSGDFIFIGGFALVGVFAVLSLVFLLSRDARRRQSQPEQQEKSQLRFDKGLRIVGVCAAIGLGIGAFATAVAHDLAYYDLGFFGGLFVGFALYLIRTIQKKN